LLVGFSSVAFGQLDQSAPAELDESLRAAVNQFYAFFQRGRFREAEDLVDHESKDLFYDARKERIQSFELKQINWADDFREADVLVAASWVVPMMGAKPVPVPLSSNWRLVDGAWRLHLELRSRVKDGVYTSPAGAMTFSDRGDANLGAPSAIINDPRTLLDAIAHMYEVSENKVAFQRRGEGVQTREVTVANKGDGNLTLEQVSKATGVEVSIEQPKFGPGEQAKIVLTFDPAVGSPTDQQVLPFLVMPISQRFELTIDFK